MDRQVSGFDAPHTQPGDASARGAESSNSGKGKGKEASFSNRLQASGRMALNAVVETQPSLSRPGHAKAGAASTSRDQSSVSESAGAEASRSRDVHVHGLGDSLRSYESVSEQASAQYEQFLNAPPQIQNALQPDPQVGPQVQSQSFREQTAVDGAAVVHLLSIPDEEPNYSEFDELLPDHEIARLREAFFSNSSSRPTWDHLLNFNPDFMLESRRAHEAKFHMGTEDIMTAHTTWLEQWHDVLGSYTDDVWGDLGSLAKDARREIEEIEAASNTPHTDIRTPESKALERLRQILSHVRGRN